MVNVKSYTRKNEGNKLIKELEKIHFTQQTYRLF